MKRYCATHEAMTEHVWIAPSGSECVLCLRGRARRNVSFAIVTVALLLGAALLITLHVFH